MAPELQLVSAALAGASITALIAYFQGQAKLAERDQAREAALRVAATEFQRETFAIKEACQAELAVVRQTMHEQQESHHQAIHQINGEAQARIDLARQEGETEFKKQLLEHSASALSVSAHPFVSTTVEKGIFTRENKVEIGYKYQLFVQGLPCFEPHTVVLESKVMKEVNEQTMALLQSKAVQAAEAAVNIKSGGVASKVISVAKAAIQYAT